MSAPSKSQVISSPPLSPCSRMYPTIKPSPSCSECNFDVVIPSTLWFGEFYVTAVVTNTSGFSVAQTATTVYFTGPNSDVISRTVATPAAVQPLVMPTQAATYYGSNNLPVVQSRKALSGSTAAVLLITPDAYFSPSDFASMLTASNSTAYTM